MVELGTKTAACKHGNDSFNLFRTHSVHLQVLQLMQGTHFCVPQLMAAAPRLSSLWILSFCTDHPLLIHASTPIAASTPISWLHDFYFHSYTKEAKITFQTLTLNFTSWFLFWNLYLLFHILYLHIQQDKCSLRRDAGISGSAWSQVPTSGTGPRFGTSLRYLCPKLIIFSSLIWEI